MVSLYAKLIGELMFIAINTQPLIAQPVNALARFMTTANSELYVLAKGVLRYLKGVKSRKIVWGASRVKAVSSSAERDFLSPDPRKSERPLAATFCFLAPCC